MPIDPDTIERFLSKSAPSIETVKELSADQCMARITQYVGAAPEFKTPPRLAQLHGLVAALETRRTLMLFDMRMGKTKLALDWASHLALSGRWEGRGLVIVPSPVITSVWANQALQHSYLSVRIVSITRPADLFDVLMDDTVDLIIVAWSSLQGMFTEKRLTRATKTKPARPKLFPAYDLIEAASQYISLMIIDEIHTAKAYESLRFQIAAGLNKKTTFFMGLTGTPWGRSPFAAWAQAYLVDDGETLGRNPFFFEAAFGYEIKIANRKQMVFDKKKLPILQRKLAAISLTYKHKDQGKGVYEGVVALAIKGDQRKAYLDAIDNMIKLPDGANAALRNIFVRLRQIASGFLPFVDEEGVEHILHFQDNIKREWLEDFVENIGDIKCVFFHEFTATGAWICDVLQKGKVKHVWLHGATKDRGGTIKAFEHGDAQVCVVQAASGSMGIELLAAHYQAFIEAPLSAIVRQQAERRAQGEARNGRALYIDDLVCAPVERRILEMTREGKDMLGALYKNSAEVVKSLRL